jgi:hypothetical protein
MSDDQSLLSRRNALKCMAYGGSGTLFALAWHLGRGPARLGGGRLEGTAASSPLNSGSDCRQYIRPLDASVDAGPDDIRSHEPR